MRKTILFIAVLTGSLCTVTKPMAMNKRQKGTAAQIDTQLLLYAKQLGEYIDNRVEVPQFFFTDMAQFHVDYHQNLANNFNALNFYNLIVQQARAHNQLARRNKPAEVQPLT